VERVTPRARRTLALVALLLPAACGRGDANGAQGPYARDVADAIPAIEKGTGLKFKRTPVLQTRTRAQVRAFLEQRFRDEVTDAEIAGQQTMYRRIGLLPDTLDLRKFLIDLLTEQVVGFYDPRTKVLYVVQDAPHEQVGFVIQHELVHALQDQYMNLDSLQAIQSDNDRSLAAQAVIEGQATLVPLQSLLGFGANLPGGWDRVRDAIRDSHGSDMAVFRSAPMLIQETLIFPYLSGADFMRHFEMARPGEEPYGKNMPTSTEQILHFQKYDGPGAQAPLVVTFARPARGRVTYEDDLGEFETRLFLFQFLQDQNAAVRGAAGWAGDRYEVLDLPGGAGVAWLTVWDSPVDAGEFGSDVEQVIAKRFGGPKPRETLHGTVYAVKDRTVTLWGGTVDGHPAVLYTDLPAGVDAGIVRIGSATIGR